MLSTRQAPNVVENYLKEELELGRVVKLLSFPGPLNADLFLVRNNTLVGVVVQQFNQTCTFYW